MSKKGYIFVFLFFVIFLIILFLSLFLDNLFWSWGVDSKYQQSITVEILGSGIIAFTILIVGIIFQKTLEKSSNERKAQNYYNNWLKKDLEESLLRDNLGWDYLRYGSRFYFSSSFINTIYEKYDENKVYIWELRDYLLKNETFSLFEDIFNKTRLAYVQAEKFDNQLQFDFRKRYNKQRSNGVSEVQYQMAYLQFRVSIFAPGQLEEFALYSVESPFMDFTKNNKLDKEYKSQIKELNDLKIDLNLMIKKLERLLNE